MRCERVQYLYDDYVRSNLPLTGMSRVEDHLAGCPSCREFYEQNDAIAGLLRHHQDVAHPGPQYFESLARKVLSGLDQLPDPHEAADPQPAAPRPLAAWRQPLWWAGSLAAAALLALGLMPTRVPPVTRSIMAARPLAAEPSQPVGRLDLSRIIASISGLIGPIANESTIRTIEKGVVGPQGEAGTGSGDPAVALSRSPQLSHGGAASDAAGRTTAQQATTREVEVRLAGLREKADQSMPTEVLQQIQLIKTQLASGGGDAALLESLRQLEDTVRRRIDERAGLDSLPWVRQAGLYLKAEDALAAGDPTGASSYYLNVLRIDESIPPAERPSLLAIRAALQLADLFYSEWADFQAARDYYGQCASPRAAEALTRVERDNVASQLDRLNRFSANHWETLHLLQIVRREGWPQAMTALRKLLSAPQTASLWPEAARKVVERMNEEPAPKPQTTIEIYNLLANQASVEQNGDIRAWLELSLGDLSLAQFKDSNQARERYRKAIEAGGDSGAAQSARAKLDDLVERQLIDLVR
jgi:hypothetical protein